MAHCRESKDPSIVPMSVKPRKRVNADIPLIACDRDGNAVSDLTGEYALIDTLIYNHPRAMIVCADPVRVLELTHHMFHDDPQWNFRAIPIDKIPLTDDQPRTHYTTDVISFLGFQAPEGKGGRHNRYFYPISPRQFCGKSIAELVPGKKPILDKLLIWGKQVQEFVQQNELRFSPSSGGLAGQLLRDERFYPEARRKIPTATNEKCRQALPGNCYVLNARTQVQYTAALYIDQSAAHHWAARNVTLPDSRIIAGGHYNTLRDKPWIVPGKEPWDNFIRERHGLLYCNVDIPPNTARKTWIPPDLKIPGTNRLIFIHTNERKWYESLGVRINYICAGWTTPHIDTGLPRYAQWAQEQLHTHKDKKEWLKTVLLASYGLLGARPKVLRSGYWQAKRGDATRYNIGPREYNVLEVSGKPTQMPTANVIQRGMIEAETRKQSLMLAQWLEDEGYHVLSVYADGILVHDPAGKNTQLPMLPPPWRFKERLNMIEFLDPTSWISSTTSKLPGRPWRTRRPPPKVGGNTNGHVRPRAAAQKRTVC